MYCVICGKYRKFKNPKVSYSFEKKKQHFLLLAVSMRMKIKIYLKKKNQLRY